MSLKIRRLIVVGLIVLAASLSPLGAKLGFDVVSADDPIPCGTC